MSNLDRRNFLKISACSLVGITMGGVSLRAVAEEQIKLDDPLAVAMKYVHKSTVEGATCANCAHIKGDAAAGRQGVLLRRLETAGGFLARAGVAFDLVGDLLAFVQRAEARGLEGRGMDEHVLAAVIGLHEAIALGGIVPFHNAGRHFRTSVWR